MNTPVFRPLAALLLAALPAAAQAQWVDFAQLDGSSESSTLVLVRQAPRSSSTEPAPLASASVTRWASGEALALGYVVRWKLSSSERQWVVGAGLGANSFRSRAAGDEARESALSARLQSEWFGPAFGGSYYALAQASSFRGAWFATLQYSLPSLPLALEGSRYRERSYAATSLGLRLRLGETPWFVRAGAVRDGSGTRPFAGLSYNAF